MTIRKKIKAVIAAALIATGGGSVAAYQYWDAVGCALPSKYQDVLDSIRPLQCRDGTS